MDAIFALAVQLRELTEETIVVSKALSELHLVEEDEKLKPIKTMESNLYDRINEELKAFINMINTIKLDGISRDEMEGILTIYNELMTNLQEWAKIKLKIEDEDSFKKYSNDIIAKIKETEIRLENISEEITSIKVKLGFKRIVNSFEREERRISSLL